MCCLFGILDYSGKLSLKSRQKILRILSAECEERGTDATGIAYFTGNRLTIHKAPKPARKMRFQLSTQARYIMGHTRMTTQGSEKRNYNNHPFSGRAGRTSFALAHNYDHDKPDYCYADQWRWYGKRRPILAGGRA